MGRVEELVRELIEIAQSMSAGKIELQITSANEVWRMRVEDLTDVKMCRICGCTQDDCRQCIEASSEPCYWVEDDLCSRCEAEQEAASHA